MCLEQGVDCLPARGRLFTISNPIISCLIKIQNGYTFLVPAYSVQTAINWEQQAGLNESNTIINNDKNYINMASMLL